MAENNRLPSFQHVDPSRGVIVVDCLSPVVVMKKIKLRNPDASGRVNLFETLPELFETDESTEEDTLENQNKTIRDAEQLKLDEHLSRVHAMTNEELNSHIQKCLEMNSENKITPKNAFAFQLIDCINILVQKKKDFSAMACTLDAGAKIYSCRVDALHQQVIKLADEVLLHHGEKKNNSEKDRTETDEKINEKRRKENKKNVIAPAETLRRKLKGKDPKDKYIKVDGLPGAIMCGVKRDGKDLSLSLENNVSFWPNWDGYNPLKAEGMVTLPEFKIIRDKAKESETNFESAESESPLFDYFNINDRKVEEYPQQDNEAEIVDASSNDIFEEPVYSQFDNDINPDEVNVVSTAMMRLDEEAEGNGTAVTSRFEAMKVVFDDVSEYNYLNIKNAHYWAGPEFWKLPKGKNHTIIEKTRKKKEPREINYDCDNIDEKWNMSKMSKKALNLTKKTVLNWKNRKFTLPADLKVQANVLLDLFHTVRYSGPDDELNKTEGSDHGRTTNDSFPGLNSQESMASSTFQDTHDAGFYAEGSQDTQASGPLGSALYDVPLHQPECHREQSGRMEQGKILKVQFSTSDSGMFDGTPLLPAPKMVTFQPIKYSTRPNRVDMQHLKHTMMEAIKEEIKDDWWNMKASGLEDRAYVPEAKFENILKRLAGRLDRRTAEDLAPGMAFLALLTLANENNLQLNKTETKSDVTVRVEDFESLVKYSSGNHASHREAVHGGDYSRGHKVELGSSP